MKKYFFSTTDTRKFIEKYLNNDKLSDEQKEYLLECLESGMSVKEMDSFASEHLSVDQICLLYTSYPEKRDCYSELYKYVTEHNPDYNGKICALYGLRRTGKTCLLYTSRCV